MLEGLEISEIKISSIDLKKRRLDSEFYDKQNLQANKLLQSIPNKKFGDIIDVLTDYHANGSYETLRDNVVLLEYPEFAHMVRTTDFLRDDFEKNIISITENAYHHLSKTKLFGGEILINKIGSYTGQSFLMPKVKRPSSLGMNIFMLKLKKDYSSEFYQTYLTTNVGKILVEQQISGASPKSIDKESVRNILVPLFSSLLQNEIKNIRNLSLEIKKEQKSVYSKAVEFLLEELKFNNFQPNQDPVNVKTFSESFGSSGRLDAEYYQVKYEEVVNKIQSTNHDKLSNLVKIKKSIEPGSHQYSEEGLPFIRVSDYDKFGFSTPDKYIKADFCKENRELIKKLKPKKETILFSKDGSVGTAYMLRNDADFITSGAILHLTVKDKKRIIPEYLTLALNSKLVQMQAERDAGGSIILHWRVGEIENVVVPIINIAKQQQIADLVEQSFTLKKQSEHLLEVAKQAVEMAIKQDEETAMEWIKSQL